MMILFQKIVEGKFTPLVGITPLVGKPAHGTQKGASTRFFKYYLKIFEIAAIASQNVITESS